MKIKIIFYLTMTCLSLLLLQGCQVEEPTNNGLTDTNIDASFTITPKAGTVNRYILNGKTTNIINSKWNLGDGSSDYSGNFTDEFIFLPDAGTYTITHTVIGRGGATKTATQTLTVPNSDAMSGNLIKGGKFQNATDHSKWIILNISNNNNTDWTFNNGSITVNGGGWNQKGFYQAIDVVANKSYKIDMQVSGSGSQNTWFEVLVSPTPPVQNTDYTAGGRRMGLSTWDGCGGTPFSGKLSSISCVGSGGTVSFGQSGTVYFVIKSGGENIGSSGITVTNIEFRGI
jgi:hypothetical protein